MISPELAKIQESIEYSFLLYTDLYNGISIRILSND